MSHTYPEDSPENKSGQEHKEERCDMCGRSPCKCDSLEDKMDARRRGL